MLALLFYWNKILSISDRHFNGRDNKVIILIPHFLQPFPAVSSNINKNFTLKYHFLPKNTLSFYMNDC